MQDLEPLVSPRVLAARYGEPDLVPVDIRFGPGAAEAFAAGHVPGAVHGDYTAGWRVARSGGGAGMLPDPDALAALLGGLRIRPESRVVVISAGRNAGDFAAAARAYWTLRAAGHRRVSLLDGGQAAWEREGLPVETGPVAPAPAPAYPVRPDPAIRATLADVERALADGTAALVDTRNRASFEGEETSPVAARGGRLPGAIHREGARAWDAERGVLRSRGELEALFPDLGRPAISACNTGQQAAANWFVESELLGRPGATLYDGSMSEWTADPARPVETGPA